MEDKKSAFAGGTKVTFDSNGTYSSGPLKGNQQSSSTTSQSYNSTYNNTYSNQTSNQNSQMQSKYSSTNSFIALRIKND